MSTRARERFEDSGERLQQQTASSGASATPPAAANKTRTRKVSPVLEPEDDTEDEDDEVDETFLALQKLLMNMEGNRLSQVAPVSLNAHMIHANSGGSNATTVNMHQSNTNNSSNSTNANHRHSQEEILESRRREREQFRHLLLSKSSASQRRRRPAYYCFDEDDEDDETPAPSVESTISNRMMNGSFSRYSVHAISRDRWAKEDPERLPIVLLPKDGKISSPADNPKLNVMHTAEYIDLSEQMEAKLQNELKDHVCYLTPPRSTWCIQMRDFEALHC